ncbi:hypothetical protein [Blattabacterium cuenoti]|uniref:hypothetical protein n=1 Tax=Blattabacterium cuenoti TaxID=1653831 RepID=UPI00163BAC27|nr:hypothetical protein [Blattabacterium cuenoti]
MKCFFFITNFLHRKWSLFKKEILRFFISVVTDIFIVLFSFIFLILILFLGSILLCFFLSYYFDNYIIGFGIITFLYLVFFIFIFFLCKKVTRYFIKNLLKKSIIEILGKNKKD